MHHIYSEGKILDNDYAVIIAEKNLKLHYFRYYYNLRRL